MNNAVVLDTVPEWAGPEARPENRLELAGTNLEDLNFHTATAAVPVAVAQHRWKPPLPAAGDSISELESSMNQVQVEQKTYQMPPQEGFSVAHFLTVADIERSARFYEKVFGGRILSRGDSEGAPAYIQIANTWLLVNVGGGPTADKPTVTLSVPDPDKINGFMNIRVADIQACYELWRSRGAEFITEPIPKYGEIRCYIRDPDGYIIEVGQSTDLKYG
jgi:catechol 2,3-dioxygenase-like lactoylglutathione lyase family enzyme